MTIALARRYRPKRFSELLVQEHVASVLRGAVTHRRVGHGYLLTGPRGVGKTTAARILAMALNCERSDPEHPAGEPCGECPTCLRIWNGAANLDVVEIDAASNRGVDDARDLRERAMYAASQEGRYKVYIVDEAHMLTREAWNALLKVLEEPPPRVVFVFATTEPQKIAATAAPVLSRLQRFDFRRIGPGAIHARLAQVLEAEEIAAEPDALLLIAKHADGGMRDALSILDQCLSLGDGGVTEARVREVLGLVGDELYADLLQLIAKRDPAAVFPLVDRLVNAGADLTEFIGGAAETLRALLRLQVGAEEEEMTDAMRQALATYRSQIEPGDLLRMLALLSDSEIAIRRGGSPRLQVETLLLRWSMMDRIVDLREVLSGGTTGSGGRRKESARGAAAPEPAPASPGPPGGASALAQPERPGAAGGAAPVPEASPIEFSAKGIEAAWPDLIETGRGISRFLGEALTVASLTAVSPPRIELRLGDPNPMFAEALNRNIGALEQALAPRLGRTPQIRVAESGSRKGEPEGERPRRYSEERLKSERLEASRALDPALDVAATELDLEIME